MEKPIFKIGDTIVGEEFKGVEEATITRIDDKYYYLKILCGTGIIPIKSQVNYKLKTKK